MANQETIELTRDARGIATLTLNRPEVRNAMNATMIAEITDAFAGLSADKAVRAVVIRGAGKVFCAGGDLNWMRDVEGYTKDEVAEDSRRLQDMYRAILDCSKLTIARIHGAAMAGGMGMVACCDAALARDNVKFRLTEVRIGLAPGIISPFLLTKIGPGWLRYLTVSAAMFGVAEALRMGLVHASAEDDTTLDGLVDGHISLALDSSPDAIANSKRLLAELGGAPDAAVLETGLRWNVTTRTSPEAKAGIGAFLDRRPPPWGNG